MAHTALKAETFAEELIAFLRLSGYPISDQSPQRMFGIPDAPSFTATGPSGDTYRLFVLGPIFTQE